MSVLAVGRYATGYCSCMCALIVISLPCVQSEKAMFERITTSDVVFPAGTTVSVEAQDLITSLLEKEPGMTCSHCKLSAKY